MYIICVYSFRCIRGILSDKIVILVTHQVQYLERCDAILGLKEVSCIYHSSNVVSMFIHNLLVFYFLMYYIIAVGDFLLTSLLLLYRALC